MSFDVCDYSFSDAFGFHELNGVDDDLKIGMNVLNGLGWIPTVGVIIGFARLIFAAMVPYPALQSGLIFRAFLEILDLGFLLPIPDLIMTFSEERQDRVALCY